MWRRGKGLIFPPNSVTSYMDNRWCVKLSKHTASFKCLYFNVYIRLVSSQHKRHYDYVTVNVRGRQSLNQVRHGALHTIAQCTAAHLSLFWYQSSSVRRTLPYTLWLTRDHLLTGYYGVSVCHSQQDHESYIASTTRTHDSCYIVLLQNVTC